MCGGGWVTKSALGRTPAYWRRTTDCRTPLRKHLRSPRVSLIAASGLLLVVAGITGVSAAVGLRVLTAICPQPGVPLWPCLSLRGSQILDKSAVLSLPVTRCRPVSLTGKDYESEGRRFESCRARGEDGGGCALARGVRRQFTRGREVNAPGSTTILASPWRRRSSLIGVAASLSTPPLYGTPP